jgi:hypothetical protein
MRTETEAKLRVLSLGWGVQSFTLAAMSALGELPKLDLIIHADTSYERSHTYEFASRWLPWIVQHGLSVSIASSRTTRNPLRLGTKVNIPAYLVNKRGEVSRINRQCTGRWKIEVVRDIINQELAQRGLRKTPGVVEQWLGISWDEASRAKNSKVKYITIRHPFLERETRMRRGDCVNWLLKHGLEVPGKSSCYHCPFRSKAEWEEMKRVGGSDWTNAIAFDRSIRDKSTKYKSLFVHRSARPLEEAVLLAEDEGFTQPDLLPGPGCDTAGYCWD